MKNAVMFSKPVFNRFAILLSAVLSVVSLSCNDVLYHPEDHSVFVPSAFISVTKPVAGNIDSSGLAIADTVLPDTKLYLVGLTTGTNSRISRFWDIEGDIVDDTVAECSFRESGPHAAFYVIKEVLDFDDVNIDKDTVWIYINNPPRVKSLDSPENNAGNVNPAGGLVFKWTTQDKDDNDTIKTELFLTSDGDFGAPAATVINADSLVYTGVLADLKFYSWMIIAKDRYGWADTSSVYRFFTNNPSVNDGSTINGVCIINGAGGIPGVNISLYSDHAGTVKTSTGQSGNFVFTDVGPAGQFTIVASKSGCTKDTVIHTVNLVGDISNADTLFISDTTAPEIDNIYPVDTVIDRSTLVSASLSDKGAGISISGTVMQVNGDTVTAVVSDTSISWTPSAQLADSDYTVLITALDLVGNITEFQWTFTVRGIGTAPVITDMSADEYVIAGASTTISAQVMDLNDSVLTYYWDFNSDGIVDLTGTESSVSRIFDSTGTQIITLVVRDPSNESDTASVVINVVDESKRVIYIPGDTIVDYESEVVCSVKVLGFFNDLTVEVDTSNSGDFFELEMNRLTGVYRFNPGDACQWDSVKIRIRDEDGFSVDTGFDVAIRPRQVALLSIDSTDTSITVNFKKTSESDFVEYRIYRNLTMNVDTSSELWATITDPMQTSKTSEIASYAWQPKYYRVYQLDSEGLLSEAGAAVYGVIRNSAPSAPEILEPLQDSAVMWTNSRILWTKSRDKNDSPVFYRVSIDSGNGFFTLIDELEDTSTFLHEISNAIISIRVEAYDNFGAVSASERTGIRVPDISRMRIIPGGSFINDKGTFVGIGSSFYMESHEVTYGLYNYITGESRGSGVSPDKPVQATFYDAIKFCNMRSDSEGLQRFYYYDSISSDTVYNLHLFTNRNGYRLPEENQWELAAHGGVQAQWPTYDGNIGPDKANYASDTSVDVASYPPNPYGVYDMAGNAAEWCWDEIGGNRSLRGGNYTDTDEANLKAARKLSAPPKTNQLYIGFRCIREL